MGDKYLNDYLLVYMTTIVLSFKPQVHKQLFSFLLKFNPSNSNKDTDRIQNVRGEKLSYADLRITFLATLFLLGLWVGVSPFAAILSSRFPMPNSPSRLYVLNESSERPPSTLSRESLDISPNWTFIILHTVITDYKNRKSKNYSYALIDIISCLPSIAN